MQELDKSQAEQVGGALMFSTMAVGEEGGGHLTTMIVGEEGPIYHPTTMAIGEEGDHRLTTLALGEEGGWPVAPVSIGSAFGSF